MDRSGADRWRLRRFLVAAASGAPCDREALALVQYGGIHELAQLAGRHGLTSLVHDRLAQFDATMPVDMMADLAAGRAAAQATRLHAHRTMAALATTLEVPFLVVKGPAVAAQFYPDPTLREFSDIDVLVRRSDFAAARQNLIDAGFEPLSTNWEGFRAFEVAEVPLGFGHSVVDLHWHLIATGANRRDFCLDERELFDSAVPIVIGRTSVQTLCPVDTLLHLCINIGLDGARKLRGLIDIDVVVRSDQFDHGRFIERAHGTRAVELCGAVLQRARLVLGTPIPSSLLAGLSPGRTWMIANAVVDRAAARLGMIRSFAPGLLVESGRSTLPATVTAILSASRRAVRHHLGRPGLADAGGPLDWIRPTSDTDVAEQRRLYVAWVSRK